jgi:hypothetical protein
VHNKAREPATRRIIVLAHQGLRWDLLLGADPDDSVSYDDCIWHKIDFLDEMELPHEVPGASEETANDDAVDSSRTSHESQISELSSISAAGSTSDFSVDSGIVHFKNKHILYRLTGNFRPMFMMRVLFYLILCEQTQ